VEDLDTEFGLTKKIHGINTQLDDAVRLLAEAGGSNSKSPRRRWKRVLRKIDLGVCVTMCIIYCIQSIASNRSTDQISPMRCLIFRQDTNLMALSTHGSAREWPLSSSVSGSNHR